MNEKDKMIEVIKADRCLHPEWIHCTNCKYDKSDDCRAARITDALLANGIGDVAEGKRRVEVADRALKNVIKQYKRCDSLGACEECAVREKGCIEELCERYKNQAEREIAEEKGNG